MTTSATTASVMTVAQIAQAALEELAVVSAGEDIGADDLAVSIRELNWMLKTWAATDGINAWRDVERQVLFPAGTPTVPLPGLLDLSNARSVTSYERPLVRWTVGQYRDLPNKAAPGYPSVYVVTKTTNATALTVWPVPAVDMIVICDGSRVPDDVTDGAETLDIPQEWMEAVVMNLAARLIGTYGVTRTDPSTAQAIVARAGDIKQRMMDQDRPASIYMGSLYADLG